MHEPSLRSSRLAIAGGLAAAVAVAGAGFFLGRVTSPAPSSPEPAPAAQSVPTPPLPELKAPRALSRADLISLGSRAADAVTSGRPLPADIIAAAGRRFDVVLPFGCDGPAPEGSSLPLRWRYEADKQTLRIHAAPTRWTASDWGLAPTSGAEPQMEGFWVSRPWSSAEQCPQARGQAAVTSAQPVTLPGQTLALAEVLPEGQRRTTRPYETVQLLPPERFSAAQGFRLRVTGHIEKLPDAEAVQCIQPAGIEQRPLCVIGVTFDDVRIENPLDGKILATWSIARTPRTAP